MTKISGPLTINFYLHNPVRLIDEKSTDFISQTVGLINTKSIHQNNIIVGNGARRPPPPSLPVLPMRMRRRAVTNLRTNPAVAIVPPQICWRRDGLARPPPPSSRSHAWPLRDGGLGRAVAVPHMDPAVATLPIMTMTSTVSGWRQILGFRTMIWIFRVSFVIFYLR